ncbi:MAG: histidinol-phosphate aminotransferase family protein [Syntrophales bacterium]|nr:histidinol-phosphate aminotransferase family protein [Syntrophales bacterium]
MIKAKREVEALTRYVAPLEGRRPMLRLDFNENTVGPSPRVVEAIRQLPPQEYATYPEYEGLVEAYAEFVNVPPEHVAAFNGVDGAIHAIFDAFGEKGDIFLTTIPTFGYYRPCALQHGMVLEEVPYEMDLSYPLDEVKKRLRENPRLFFICNPNNPTGTLIEPDEILELARLASETLIVVDELYVSFTGKSVIPQALTYENVIALQSLSKAAGIAGLRLGFAIGPPRLVELVSRVTGPYDINAFAVAAGKAALSDRGYIDLYVEEVKKAKEWSIEQLKNFGIKYFSDGGNFLLVWPPDDCEKIVSALRNEGILVRSMKGKPLIDGSFRLTIGTREQMKRFFEVFLRLLKTQ